MNKIPDIYNFQQIEYINIESVNLDHAKFTDSHFYIHQISNNKFIPNPTN